MRDETKILNGLRIAPRGIVYVLIGYNTTREEDFHRVQKIHDLKHDPYVMPYNRTRAEMAFKRFIDSRMYRKFKTIGDAWRSYEKTQNMQGMQRQTERPAQTLLRKT